MESKLTDTKYIFSQIRGSKPSRESCIRQILTDMKYRNSIAKIVKERSGTGEDVNFVMNHTLVAFMKQVLKNRELTIDGNLYSYLNGVAKFIWLGELRQRKRITDKETNFDYETHEIADDSFELQILDKEKGTILLGVLSKIGEKCKQVLLLWSAGYSMKEIAAEAGYNSEGVARKKKFQCMKSLSSYLDNNPDQKEMLR